MSADIVRRAIAAAYNQGWRDACSDHLAQRVDENHPIGASKRDLDPLLYVLDPTNLLGLRGGDA